jgi:hypothetical protein
LIIQDGYRKKIIIILAMMIVFSFQILYPEENDEITLFDYDGNAIAYIDTSDRDLTLYLWDRTPAAYLYNRCLWI